ncbi:MAG: SDR family oxidoreductase [Chloroflexi bacterium]|jgi:nucleoside-diphosphate-sugar epimerase|nr:SDR family oxidoreductase [Chloroflexota bacterium]
MRVLFIGGTGNISSACVERALAKGYQVHLFNRGQRPAAFSQPVTTIEGDRNDPATMRQVAETGHYDVVANFVGFTPDQVELDIAAFAGRVGQYIYISSASVYQKPLNHYRITESTPLSNPYWEYSQNKIACEEILNRAYREQSFPMTIVRPTYTYGHTWIPAGVGGHGYTIVGRMRRGQPIISHGDGQSLWVMTHNTDFAVGFVGLFGRLQAIGEAFHITSDEVLTWDAIYRTIAQMAGVDVQLVHIPSDFIAAAHPDWGPGLLGDKAISVVFDNSKIKRLVPEFQPSVSFMEGIGRSITWHDADPARQVIDEGTSRTMDRIIAAYQRALADLD